MKKDIVIAAVAIVLVAAVSYGIAAVRPDLPLTPSQPFAAPLASKTKAAKTGPVVMHVNGEPVTEAEFIAFAEGAPEQNRQFLVGTPEGRNVLADEVVKLKALEQEAERLGIANETDVQVQVAMTRAQIIAGRALQQLVKDSVEAKVRAEYEKEKNNTITLRHIVVAYAGGQIPPRGGQPLPPAAAMQKANALVARIRGGAGFAEVARRESDDAESGGKGGSLGATRREMLPPEIASVVNKLQPGQVSDPVQTPFGVHIFRVDQPTLDDLRPALTRRAQEAAVEETLGRLTKSAKVEKDPKFFQTPIPAKSRG
ncbi:MAG TPA: peptidylprolyl isomerase [Thermoanaerobaculia bacterium]|nr:peptidylprolyl isomerase [Thermoanaerobaculia bacterium]